jgi:hypothetical protein
MSIALLAPSMACAQETTFPPTLEADLEELLEWFPGVYDNHRQVYRQAVERVPEEMRQRHTNHIFRPLSITGIPGRTLYAQQSQDYDLNDLYRQRIYSFKVDQDEQAIRLTIYTPHDPARLTDAHLDPAKVAEMTVEDFYLKPGCEVFWRRGEGQFDGILKTNACSYFSEMFGKRVYLNESLTLRPDALILHDRAVDAEGNLVFGSADKGPTINLKIED